MHLGAALYERQIRAVEELWGVVVSLAPAKAISSMMMNFKWDVAAEKAQKDSQVREMFKVLGSGFDFSKLQTTDARKVRPFVSPLAWAYYSAYEAIVLHAVLIMRLLQSGLDIKLANTEYVTKLIKVSLSHYENYIETYGPSAFASS